MSIYMSLQKSRCLLIVTILPLSVVCVQTLKNGKRNQGYDRAGENAHAHTVRVINDSTITLHIY